MAECLNLLARQGPYVWAVLGGCRFTLRNGVSLYVMGCRKNPVKNQFWEGVALRYVMGCRSTAPGCRFTYFSYGFVTRRRKANTNNITGFTHSTIYIYIYIYGWMQKPLLNFSALFWKVSFFGRGVVFASVPDIVFGVSFFHMHSAPEFAQTRVHVIHVASCCFSPSLSFSVSLSLSLSISAPSLALSLSQQRDLRAEWVQNHQMGYRLGIVQGGRRMCMKNEMHLAISCCCYCNGRYCSYYCATATAAATAAAPITAQPNVEIINKNI